MSSAVNQFISYPCSVFMWLSRRITRLRIGTASILLASNQFWGQMVECCIPAINDQSSSGCFMVADTVHNATVWFTQIDLFLLWQHVERMPPSSDTRACTCQTFSIYVNVANISHTPVAYRTTNDKRQTEFSFRSCARLVETKYFVLVRRHSSHSRTVSLEIQSIGGGARIDDSPTVSHYFKIHSKLVYADDNRYFLPESGLNCNHARPEQKQHDIRVLITGRAMNIYMAFCVSVQTERKSQYMLCFFSMAPGGHIQGTANV